jgi:hypothetical protein
MAFSFIYTAVGIVYTLAIYYHAKNGMSSAGFGGNYALDLAAIALLKVTAK